MPMGSFFVPEAYRGGTLRQLTYIRSLRIHGGKWQAVTTDSPEEGWIAAGFSAYDNLTLTLESVARGLLSNI